MTKQRTNAVYCGNILQIANKLARMPEVELKAIIYDDNSVVDDFLRLGSRYSVPVVRVLDKDDFLQALESLGNLDLGIIANFGIILKKEHISIPKFGFINAHPGSIPSYIGKNPVEMALLAKADQTALTLHHVTEAIDEGPVIKVQDVAIPKNISHSILCNTIYSHAPRLISEFISEINVD